MLCILHTLVAYSFVVASTTRALALNVNTSKTSASNGTDFQADPPHPPGFNPSSCQRSTGPNPWSWNTATTSFGAITNFSINANNDKDAVSAPPAGCVQIASDDFSEEPLLNTIKTPYVTIPADVSHDYYFSWTLSKRAIAAIWIREENSRTWTELYTFMMTAQFPASFELAFPKTTELTIDVNLRSLAGENGTTGIIALFRIPKRRGSEAADGGSGSVANV